MGQRLAIFYKYWLLTKKQKIGFCCQVISPLFCLMLIKLIIFIVSNVKIEIGGFNGSSVIPVGLYPCNLITPKWRSLYGEFFDIESVARINRWTSGTPEVEAAFSYWLKH
jgi:hypothetical protein